MSKIKRVFALFVMIITFLSLNMVISAATVTTVDIVWGDLSYNYVQGWDNVNHIHTYDLNPKSVDANKILIKNSSAVGITANVSFVKANIADDIKEVLLIKMRK